MPAGPDNTNPSRPAVGCVSFLNARPLSDGLEASPKLTLRYAVPSALLSGLTDGTFDLALCPVIDFQTSPQPLDIVPVGGIGCDGPTLTVRLFSRVPIDEIESVRVDADSHTSIALMRILLYERHGLRPEIAAWSPQFDATPDTMLLIGDKVVAAAPHDDDYPHQLDLGEAWHALTGLPFLFAVWMARAGAELGALPEALDAQRRRNADHLDTVVERHAVKLGWPPSLARHYLGDLLRYAVDDRMLQAVQLFWSKAHALGLIDALRPMQLHATEPARR